ncbi:amino acid adenylation domain-containing protein [Chengkuizengella sp. SCS-71B]|uniref:amino acid adenylation domain-containing protein n=1 Tax=Chengkuizengella sp. SCS-71B TaxID=3115290 RepID=UPI0032C233DE
MKKNVLEYLENTASINPNKPAIMDKDRSISFDALHKKAKGLGTVIHHKNNQLKQPIAAFLPKGLEGILSFLGILYSGNFYVPLDIKSPKKRIQAIIENLEPMFIITSQQYIEVLKSIDIEEKNIIVLDKIYDSLQTYDDECLQNIQSKMIGTDPIYTMYTSGSTGIPKGVVIPHIAVIDYIDWMIDQFEINSNTIIGNQAPFYFDISQVDLYLSLATAATLVIIPEQLFSFPIKLIEYVNQTKINFIFWVPSVFINVANSQILEEFDDCSLRKILFIGEVMPTRHFNYWKRCLPNALYANLYGPTEATLACTYFIIDREFKDHEPLPIGSPCLNTDIMILNDSGNEVRDHEVGELCVRGSSLALGYWNDEEKTKAVFIQNPLHNNYPELIYRTGDLVYYNENKELMYIGRNDSQIKHMGYRIELGEIENTILSLKEFDTVCIIYNKIKREITMFYTTNMNMSDREVRRKLADIIPKYMIPSVFYHLNKLPLNQNLKIDRVKLANKYLEK